MCDCLFYLHISNVAYYQHFANLCIFRNTTNKIAKELRFF